MNDISSGPIGGSKTRSVSPANGLLSDPGFTHNLQIGDVSCPLSPSNGFLHHSIGPHNSATRSLAIKLLKMLL
jgi:hypothetical protein